jgi:prepilin peptidase CpaA
MWSTFRENSSFMTPEGIRTAAVLIVACMAVICDVRTRRIPNKLTFGAAAAGLAYGLWVGGLGGFGTAGLAWLIGAALFFPFFALGGMGAGDVKLLAALAAWLGPLDTIYLAIFASLAGGVFAVVVSIARGYGRQAFSNIWLMLMHWRLVGLKPVPGLTLKDTRAPRLAYAIPIAAGALCTLWRP